MYKVIRQKLNAFAVHFAVTFAIAMVTSSIVFLVWYPGDLGWLANGVDLYLLVLAVEVILGPIMSFVIYHPKKTKRHLVVDYLIVGLVQISALSYGLYSTAAARPVYEVFVKDRMELVRAIELDQVDLDEAHAPFDSLSLLGPKTICVEFPTDIEEKNDLLFSGAMGKDIQLYPKYYRECSEGEIEQHFFDSGVLVNFVDEQTLDELKSKVKDTSAFQWMPVSSQVGRFIHIYDESDNSEWAFFDYDPYLQRR